jgi:hypothetical protein
MSRGDTAAFDIACTAADGSVLNLDGCSLWFTAKNSVLDSDEAAVFQKTIGDGITVTDEQGGLATIVLAHDDTKSLGENTILQYDLQVKDAFNGIYTISRGTLVVEADVTISTT